MRFQVMAPTRPPRMTHWSTTPDSTTPLPTVLATCTPKPNAATKLKKAAHATACMGVEHARGDDGGDGIGGVVEAIDVVESEGDHDDEGHEQEGAAHVRGTGEPAQAILRVMLSTTFSTSSQRSVTASIVS